MNDRIHALLRSSNAEILDGLPRLTGRELVVFDALSRSWNEGVDQAAIRSSNVLSLLAADGRRRQRAIEAVELTPLSLQLLALRTVDWVAPVRMAALRRLEAAPAERLADAFPIAVRLAADRVHGAALADLLTRRVSDEQLIALTVASDPLVCRAAWLRIRVLSPELARRAAHDEDRVVRATAANTLGTLPESGRRELATVLIDDPVGRVASPALWALIELDGEAAIRRALASRSGVLRRVARDAAHRHGVDAREVALKVGDTLSLCELADPRDEDAIRGALQHDSVAVRVAAVRALDRATALDALERDASGRVQRMAASKLRTGGLSDDELARIQRIALDPRRPEPLGRRARQLLRPAGWTHLAVLLETGHVDEIRSIPQASPTPAIRERIKRRLADLDPALREQVEWVLGTTS